MEILKEKTEKGDGGERSKVKEKNGEQAS